MAIITLIGFIALIALPVATWLYALADVIRNEFNTFLTKLVWLSVLCMFPPFGTMLYFLIGRNQRATFHPVGSIVVFCIFVIPLLMVVAYILFIFGQLTFFPAPPESIRI
jgi:Phospholipase_D-nuclease N-terminal